VGVPESGGVLEGVSEDAVGADVRGPDECDAREDGDASECERRDVRVDCVVSVTPGTWTGEVAEYGEVGGGCENGEQPAAAVDREGRAQCGREDGDPFVPEEPSGVHAIQKRSGHGHRCVPYEHASGPFSTGDRRRRGGGRATSSAESLRDRTASLEAADRDL
jgi:hypothetical protein